MALGVFGFGCEDALVHLLNYVWPNIFETSPHLVQAFMDAVEGMRVSLGPIKILQYTLQVKLIHTYYYLNSNILLFSFSFRVFSTQPGKSAMFTGKSTTPCISEHKILSFVDTRECRMKGRTPTCVLNWTTSCNFHIFESSPFYNNVFSDFMFGFIRINSP